MSSSPTEAPSLVKTGRAKLVVISGPSGTGKTSICNALLERLPDAVWSVSATTRPLRGGEACDESYRFVSPEEFERMEASGAFLETADYVGHRYGTPEEPVRQALARGQDVIMEIEVQGGAQVARRVPDSIRIYVLPPTMESLRARLEGRATESQEQLQKRLAVADGEMGFARDSGCYPHFVVNDELEATVEEILALIEQERVQT
ncbi:MAG: guanylate kinase [bacterium]|nr:guanylate kinase [bacterium]